MYPPQAGMDDEGNLYIPFSATKGEIPFERWMTTTKKIFQSDKPIVIQNVIITHLGEVFIQYVEEIHDANEYPKEGTTATDQTNYGYTPLSEREEKRSYD